MPVTLPINVMATAERQGPGFVPIPDAVRVVFSAEIIFSALPALKFDAFTTKRTELGTQPGKTIAIPKMGSIRRGGKLVEGERIRTQGMSQSLAYVSVGERGNAIAMSEFLLQTSFYDQMQLASIQLGRDMTITLDMEIRDAAMQTTNLVRGDGSTPGTAATARNLIAGGLDTRVVKDAVETLETNNAPKFDGDYYVAFIHPHQARKLRDDDDWVNAQLYSGVTNIFTGEIGRYEDVRFISTTVMPNGGNPAVDPDTGEFTDLGYSSVLDGAGAAGVDIYQGLLMGENSVGFALALPVELRDNGVQDFGREHALAWYAIWGTDLIENKNSVILETA
jgi:N4-gp56 family major capsid protein